MNVDYGAIDVTMGALSISHLPALKSPRPMFDRYGAKQPEIVLGYSIFLAAAVRIDYAKGNVVLARRADGLVREGARAVPIREFDGKVGVEAVVEGKPSMFQLDTGSTGSFSFPASYLKDHLAAERPHGEERFRDGERRLLFRVQDASLGPIAITNRLAHATTSEAPLGVIEGSVGNDVFAHCAAIVFDVPKRTVWFEAPCNRDVPQDRSGTEIAREDSPVYRDRPWVIDAVLPGGAADRAGLKPGDRLLEVGGKPVMLDRAPLDKLFEQPAKTKLTVLYVRDTQKLRTTMELLDTYSIK